MVTEDLFIRLHFFLFAPTVGEVVKGFFFIRPDFILSATEQKICLFIWISFFTIRELNFGHCKAQAQRIRKSRFDLFVTEGLIILPYFSF